MKILENVGKERVTADGKYKKTKRFGYGTGSTG